MRSCVCANPHLQHYHNIGKCKCNIGKCWYPLYSFTCAEATFSGLC